VTTTTAAVANGYSLNGSYGCPASVSIGGRSFLNDGLPDQGQMSLATALIQSCDTVFYNLAYSMWQRDNQSANYVANPKAPAQKMAQNELGWGFGQPTGIDLPSESLGSVPTRQWVYDLWKANAHTGQNWCKYGKAGGSYIQQIEYDDCTAGYEWLPGQAVISAIGQGYVSVTPLQLANAYAALANGGTLYSPRIGQAMVSPAGHVDQWINPPVLRHLPASSYTLAYIRDALAGVVTQGTAAGGFSGFPLNKVCVAGKTGTAQAQGQQPNSVFASFAPCNHPQYVVVSMIPNSGYGADFSVPLVRSIYDDIYGLEGHKAAMPGGQTPSSLPQVSANGQITTPKGYGG
jgi:penicillin-binding protein 2